MANRNYIILEDKDGKEVLPVTDGNGVFVEGGTKKLESKLTEIDSKTTELNEQLETKANKKEVEELSEQFRNIFIQSTIPTAREGAIWKQLLN